MTPDSFSDGGELSQTQELRSRLKAWDEVGAAFVDLGAESTAPMNTAISAELEWNRLKPALALCSTKACVSIDTYKSEIITKASNQTSVALWNDISGQLDDELLQVLSNNPKLQSVYCHNLAPTRELSPKHMDYVSQQDIYQNVFTAFSKAHAWYSQHNLPQPYFDFCFGFSKTFDQNWQLLRALPKFITQFEASFGRQKWVLAVSRKSFFKQLSSEKVDLGVRQQTEYMQAYYLSWLHQNLPANTDVLVRLHDPALAHAVTRVGEFL